MEASAVSGETRAIEQWEVAARLCGEWAVAAVDLKSGDHRVAGSVAVPAARLRASRDRALGIVVALECAIRAPRAHYFVGEVELPRDFVAWLRGGGANALVNRDTLAGLRQRLSAAWPSLSDEDVAVIDSLTHVLDEQASALARRVVHDAGAVDTR